MSSKTRAERIMAECNAQFKKPVLTMGSDKRFVVEYLATDVLPFDILLGGGIPRGRFTQVVGDFSTLKSLLGLMAIAAEQRRGGVCALIDTEHTYDPEWADRLGVNTEQLIMPPKGEDFETGEQAVDYSETLIRNGVDLIVFDSVTAAQPQAYRNQRLHGKETQPARLASLMSRACAKLTAANDRTAVVWINQLRNDVGITFGNPEKPTGGRALPFYASLTIELKRTVLVSRTVKVFTGDGEVDAKEIIAQQIKGVRRKSKLSEPHREVYFDWSLEAGTVDTTKFLFAQAVEHGIVTKKGNTWSVVGNPQAKAVGQGKFRGLLANSPELRTTIEAKVRTVHGLPPGPLPAASKRVSPPKPSKPAKSARVPTLGPALGRSSAMPPLPKRSTSSSSSPRVTPSGGRT